MDSGSTLSFITLNKARKLKLKGKPIRVHIMKVGGIEENLETFEYSLYLCDREQELIKITVIGIERISDDIDDVNVDEVIKKFKGVDKDAIRRPREGKIDCLIGIDYAAYHPTKVEVVDYLTLYENRFGKVMGRRGGGGGG